MSMSIGGTNGLTFPDSSTQNTAANGFGFKNRIINGDMRIDQRNNGASVTLNGGTNSYPVDRLASFASVGTITAQQSSEAPEGFVKSVVFTTTSSASVSGSDLVRTSQFIEGLNVADLGWGTANAKPVTLSFWVRSSLTGNFGGSINNSANTRCYPFSYTIAAANTWEQKIVTIAGDTTGTWLTTNSIGVRVFWSLGAGSLVSGTAGAWTSSTVFQPTGSVSVVGTSGATFYITGVQLEKGSTATSFDYRPYGTELALCQRYYYKAQATSNQFGVGWNASTTQTLAAVNFPVIMRTPPTSLETTGTASDYRIAYLGTSTACTAVPTFNRATESSGFITGAATGLTAGQGSSIYAANTVTAYLAWSAEL